MSSPTLQATVDRLEADSAVLRLPDGQELMVELLYLPTETGEGSVLDLSFEVNGSAESKAEAKARSLLNHILKGGA